MKRLMLLLTTASAALTTAPALHAEDAAPSSQFTLPNGLRVVVNEDHSTPKVAVSVWYHVGSGDEPDRKTGFAHLYEHLMFNGSENHDDEWFPPLQEIGASAVNGATSLDQTYYYEVVPTGGLDRALWLESDRMGHMVGAITQKKLDEQRAVVQNEKRQGENRPYARMSQLESAGLFPVNHPYYHSTIGSMDDLNGASLDDVKNWFRQYYGAANAVVSLAGDVTVAQAKALVTKYFGSVPAGPPVARLTSWVPALAADKTEVMQDDVPAPAVAWDWAVPGRGTPDAPALKMAADLLGSGKTSRLYKALVVDRQIATRVSVTYQAESVAGIFSIEAYLKPDADPAQAQAVTAAVVRDFLKTGPTPDELKRAKVTNYGNTVRALESIYVRAMAQADGLMFANNPAEYLEDDKRFEALTAPVVSAAANNWLSRGAYKLTVVPFGSHSVVADAADRKKMPDALPSPGLTLPASEQATLSNGIRVVFSPRHGTPTVDMTMVFDAGHAADQHLKSGLGNFTLQMMNDGPQGLTSQAFEERQAALGVRLNAGADNDSDSFYLSALSRALPESIALWASYIRTPGFRPDDLAREKALSLSNIAQSQSDAGSIAQRAFGNLIYGDKHAYGVALAGRAETLASFSRDDLVTWHDSWIRPDNAVVYASGDTTLAALTALLEQSFGSWKAPSMPRGTKTVETLPYPTTSRIVLIDKPGAIQSVIRVGELMPSGLDASSFDLGAMNEVLGGGFSARINMNLREAKGWTYGANSFVVEQRGPQLFGVATSVQTDKTAPALGEIDKEIRAIAKDRPTTPAELSMMVKGEVLSLPGQFETNQAFVQYMQYVGQLGKPYDYITTLPRRYEALTPDDITRTARDMLRPDAMTWLVVGDLAKIEAPIRALKLGTVEVWDAEGHKLR